MLPQWIQLQHVRQNNLKNISVKLPLRGWTVITGVSGSGKSSLAFDTLYAEGQRRYIESLSTYTRQFLEKIPKPDFDQILHIPPALALEQRNPVINSRSTVGTHSEILDYLRVLFAQQGQLFCHPCQALVQANTKEIILKKAMPWLKNKRILITAPMDWKSNQNVSLPKGKKKRSIQEASQLQDWFSLFQSQGFYRILLKKNNHFEILNLPISNHLDESSIEKIFLIVDRIKINTHEDPETHTRLLDSLQQTLTLGQGHLTFFDDEKIKNQIDQDILQSWSTHFACSQCSKEYQRPEPNWFSFQSPLGACQHCSGFGFTLDFDEKLIIPDPQKTLQQGAIDPFSKPSLHHCQTQMFQFAKKNGIHLHRKYCDLTDHQKWLLWHGEPHGLFPGILKSFEQLKKYTYKLHVRVFIRRYQRQNICPQCQGQRLKPESLQVRIQEKSLPDLLALSIEDLKKWIQKLLENSQPATQEILKTLEKKLSLLNEVGIGYLTLNRLTKTLSGGEFQRLNLATQLSSGLCGTLYVLDEPSIGLHAADTKKLIQILQRLKQQGNTLVVVEHDLDLITAADWMIEIGPQAGQQGGNLIAQGPVSEVIQTPQSITGQFLRKKTIIKRNHPQRPPAEKFLQLLGCKKHHLKNLNLSFPLERWVVVTGVSGSGKSTLVHQSLDPALRKLMHGITPEQPPQIDHLYGAEHLQGVVLLDQSPIGKSSRSNPATYLKLWDDIRLLYAHQPLAVKRGYTPGFFSFNTEGGRCPHCKGSGEITLDMHFMSDLTLVCDLCQGKRFQDKILEIEYRGKNIYDLLNSTLDEAQVFFDHHPQLTQKIHYLQEVGLGYLRLGQSAVTLSGGESQRLKIAATLAEQKSTQLLYLFDEPTTGLHLKDVKKLITVMNRLVDQGHSIIMIEHHLELIAQADWILDLGPGGGEQGGFLVAEGTPEELSKLPHSITGQILKIKGLQA